MQVGGTSQNVPWVCRGGRGSCGSSGQFVSCVLSRRVGSGPVTMVIWVSGDNGGKGQYVHWV